jgi:hypothetical protein
LSGKIPQDFFSWAGAANSGKKGKKDGIVFMGMKKILLKGQRIILFSRFDEAAAQPFQNLE